MRPGTYLGGTTYDHVIGFLPELASLASLRHTSENWSVRSDTEFSASHNTELSTRISELERDPNTNDRDAIRGLEPLLAAVLENVLSPET